MKLAIVCCATFIALALSGCSSTQVSGKKPSEAGDLPFDVGNGVGSQFGNYGGAFDGETHDAAGDRCFIFNWDRPLNRDYAIRYTSTSCESKEHPIWMTTTPYVRKIIPISQSHLRDKQSETGQ